MSSQEKKGDSAQRRSFRCRLPDGQREALLQVGDQTFAVRLLNESADGAAVASDGEIRVAKHDEVRLLTRFGHFEARVVHVSKIDASETAASEIDPARGDVSPQNPRLCLGLEWLSGPQTPPAVQSLPSENARSPTPSPARNI